jgi:hypothetical protein
VLEAAVIAVQHPVWQERPVACVVPRPEFKDQLTKDEIRDYLSSRVAKWWLPDEVFFLDALPKTSVGKFDKKVLRAQFTERALSGYLQVSRPVFLDTGGIDGRQARLRREIDRLKACREHYAALCTAALTAHAERQNPLPADFPRWEARVTAYEERIGTCWQKYARRNRELAHLAANLLILLALLADCHLICGENLATLRTEGHGRGVRGRWRDFRNNTTVRGELWRVLSYKCTLLGIRPDRWNRVEPPIPARTATSRPAPLPLRPRPTARRWTGDPGCAASIPSANGPARGITPPASISLGSAWPCCSPRVGAPLPSPTP